MSTSSLLRWAGLSALASGLLYLAADILFRSYTLLVPVYGLVEQYTSPLTIVASVLYLLADMLLLGGLFGLYVSQRKEAGTLGLVGFIIVLVGQTLTLGYEWNAVFILPGLAAEEQTRVAFSVALPWWVLFGSVLSYTVYNSGWLIFGIATFIAGVYRRAAVVLLILGLALVVLFDVVFRFALGLPDAALNWGAFIGAVLSDVALVWLGYTLFSADRTESARQQPPSNGGARSPT